jgi:putative endonuclease
VVFVEVKTRSGAAYGLPAEAVTWSKRRRLSVVAGEFVTRHGLEGRPCRFDVVAVAVDGERPACEVFRNAFDMAAGPVRG